VFEKKKPEIESSTSPTMQARGKGRSDSYRANDQKIQKTGGKGGGLPYLNGLALALGGNRIVKVLKSKKKVILIGERPEERGIGSPAVWR